MNENERDKAQLCFCVTRFKIIKSVDGMWGAIENGSWNGMIGMVARKVNNLHKISIIILNKK